jgi:HD superfamily phosphohydrolase
VASRMGEEEKVLKDPVHGYVYIHDPLFWDLVNTREVQRLRRIRQLGTTYLTYPGGEHSRFSHALGTYEVLRRILQAFGRNGYPVEAEWARLVMAAGLLHDIGHGPFSHALEPLWGPSHEAWGERILLDPATEVHQVLATVAPAFPGEVADVVMKRHPNRLAVSMVSGQLDADRLDYLMRDSIFTGVDYGKFDLARILRVILPLGDRLVVKRTGIHTVEAYLLARYFMYWQVYLHPVCRSGEILLRKILWRARDLTRAGRRPAAPHPALAAWLEGDALDLDGYLALDDAVVQCAIGLWQDDADPVLRDLARRLLDRRLFKYAEFPPDRDPRLYGRLEHLARERGYDPAYYLEVDATSAVYYDYYVGDEGPAGRDGALYLWDGRTLVEMSRLSRPIQGIARERQSERRVYFPESIAAEAERILGDRG